MSNLSLSGSVLLILFVLQPFTAQSIRVEPASKQPSNGRTITDPHALRQFLAKFGYLDSYEPNVDGQGSAKLESALKLYQMANGLRATGQLNDETVDDMETPRCGVPDIIVGRADARASKIIESDLIEPNSKLPTKTHLTYAFRSTALPNVGDKDVKSSCARSFQKWSSVAPFTFAEAPDGAIADIDIGFHRGSHGDTSPFGVIGNVSAHAYRSDKNTAHVHFDADENWSVGTFCGEGEVDLESVALHEIGHVLGLSHSFDKEAVMNSHFVRGTVKRELGDDDFKAVEDLFYVGEHY